MAREPFITPAMSLWLDLVRAVAAFAVLIGHAVQVGLYTGPYPFSIALQQNAVIVFFVLSGLVIADSCAGSGGRGGKDLAAYTAARIARLVPVALPALALSAGVAIMAHGAGLPPIEGVDPGAPVDWRETALAALFLSESWRSGLAINPPFWSLCYEVWFYALFAAATYLAGRKRIAWLAVLFVAAGPNIALLLPAWLAGVLIARGGTRLALSPGQARIGVALSIAALFVTPHLAEPLSRILRTIAPWNLGHSHYALSYLLLAGAVSAGLPGLRRLVGSGGAWLESAAGPIRFAANMSFSLYLLHWPLAVLLRANGIVAGDSLLAFIALLALITAAAAGSSALCEQRRHGLRKAIEAFLRRQAMPAARRT